MVTSLYFPHTVGIFMDFYETWHEHNNIRSYLTPILTRVRKIAKSDE
jgi:hypothetical protein